MLPFTPKIATRLIRQSSYYSKLWSRTESRIICRRWHSRMGDSRFHRRMSITHSSRTNGVHQLVVKNRREMTRSNMQLPLVEWKRKHHSWNLERECGQIQQEHQQHWSASSVEAETWVLASLTWPEMDSCLLKRNFKSHMGFLFCLEAEIFLGFHVVHTDSEPFLLCFQTKCTKTPQVSSFRVHESFFPDEEAAWMQATTISGRQLDSWST